MGNLNDRIQRLVLSGEEVKALTKWPNAMIEDYLGILDDISQISKEVIDNPDDAKIKDLEERVTKLEKEIENIYKILEELGTIPDVIIVTADYTTDGDEIILCNSALTVTLNDSPNDRESVKVIIENGDDTISANSDNLVTLATVDIVYLSDLNEWFIV